MRHVFFLIENGILGTLLMGRTWDLPRMTRKLHILYLYWAFTKMPVSKGEAGGKVVPCPVLWAAIKCLSRTSKSLGKDIPEPTRLHMVQPQRAERQEGLP